jgi:cytidylate kinase
MTTAMLVAMSGTPGPASSDRRFVVALDGPASSGKSSVGAAAAARVGFRVLDTGVLYRAVTAAALREGTPLDDAAALVALAGRVRVEDDGTGRLSRILLDGVDATDAIRSDAVDRGVSVVASIPEVRSALLARQRAMAAEGLIVVVGRDIGTVVLPDAPLKIFLDASVEARASRRIAERGLDPAGPEAELVREQLRDRDHRDSTRTVAPLRAAPDAVHVLNEGSFEEAVDAVVAAIETATREGTP